MAGDERTSRQRKAEGPREEFPQTPLPQIADWSWLLDTLMGLHRSVGELSHSVETLTRQGRKHEERLDRISHRLDQISHRIYAAVVVLTVVGAALLWVLNAASDELVAVVREALRQSVE